MVRIIIIYLSKAYDTLNHKSVIAKLEVYGLGSKSSGFLQLYYQTILRH